MIELFSNLWNRSFKFQLIYGFGIMITIILVSFTYINTSYQSAFLKESGMKQILNRSLSLVQTSKVWVMANDFIGLEDVMNNVSMYDDLIFATIINRDGKIIAHTDNSLVGKYIADPMRVTYLKQLRVYLEGEDFIKILTRNDSYIDIIRPIDEDKKHIAYVNIRLDQSARAIVIQDTIKKGILFSFISVIISLLFSYIVAKGLTKNLSKLIQSVKRYSAGHRNEIADEDIVKEVSKLSRAFNNLTYNLNHIEDLNQQLTKRLELSFIATQDGLWDWDIENDTIYYSPIWKKMIGYEDDELENKLDNWKSRVYPDDLRQALIDLDNHICGLSDEYNNTHRLKHKDGTWIWILARAKAMFDANGKAIRMVGTHTNITKEKEARESYEFNLEYQAHHDSLTGLPNRLLYHDRLVQGIEKAKRHGYQLAIFFIDLDRFKQINDSLGHDVGDKVLQEVSDRLMMIMRKEDTLARLGGDEFTILMENLTRTQDASILAEKIIQVLLDPMIIHNHTLYISCSIGIALYPEDDIDAVNLLKYADAAMYKAKDEGRNNFQFYSCEMTLLAEDHLALESALRHALIYNEFIVFYQPQIDGEANKLIGMEALVRWQHASDGLVSPAKFIPLAEETGLIVHLDQWVMRTAMLQVVEWYKDGLNPGRLALNLAIKQLEHKDFIPMVVQMIKETGCKPEWLAFEVTEGQIMRNPNKAIIILREISQMGIELAVDDFGTGYSSLTYLKRLPIDKLKIDQSFVSDLPYSEEDVGITKAVISLAKSLNLGVIAEGVETKAQKDFLVKNDCKDIQGYLYSKPIPAEEMEKFLKNKNILI